MNSSALIDSADRLVAQNRELLVVSRAQIASSRRLLNPWHGISGGGDDILDAEESNLYHRVRARLQEHMLPPAPRLVLAGRATVQRACVVCRRAIRPGMMQHQFDAANERKEWAHTLCLRIWIDATVELASHTHSRSDGSSRTKI